MGQRLISGATGPTQRIRTRVLASPIVTRALLILGTTASKSNQVYSGMGSRHEITERVLNTKDRRDVMQDVLSGDDG